MTTDWSLLPQILFSWKYLAFLALALAGWLLLTHNRPMRPARLILQAVAFVVLGGVLGLALPWAARQFGLHPSPMCAVSKGLAIPILFKKIGLPMLALFGAAVVLGLVGAKGFCGWACPMGAIQELVGRIPGLRRFRLSFALTNTVRIAAFALFFVVLFTAKKISYDWFHLNAFEFFHWQNLGHPAVWGPFAAVLAASLFVYRPFCALLCPLGLFTWLVEMISFGKIRVSRACTECGKCLKETDCQALPALVAGRAVVPDCHGCGDCLRVDCPESAISWRWGRG
jgi:polyferredoxin